MAVFPTPDDPRSQRHSGEPPPDLIRGAAEGQADAVDAWFGSEHRHVYRLCFGFLANAAEADDAAQDAMLHLYDHLSDWDSTRPYRAWRNTLVLNCCRDRQRRAGARRRAESAAAEAAELPASLPDPASELQRAETMDVLRRSLARLSPREREAFVLRDLEGVSTAEVAEALGVAAGTVRTLTMLARRRLRGLLAGRLGEPGSEGAFEGGGRG